MSGEAEVFAALTAGIAWGQIARYSPFHAFRVAWWDENLWVPECNRHAYYTDVQLHSLDSTPGAGICGQVACQMSLRSWRKWNRG